MNVEQIGINYVNCDNSDWHKLKGCANDVVAIRQFVMGKTKFE